MIDKKAANDYGLQIREIHENQIEELSYKELLGVIYELATALHGETTFTSDPLTSGFDDYINKGLSTGQKIAFLCWLCDRLVEKHDVIQDDPKLSSTVCRMPEWA